MFVGVVVENFHREVLSQSPVLMSACRCRIEQEREEKAVRAIKDARKNEEKRQSKN